VDPTTKRRAFAAVAALVFGAVAVFATVGSQRQATSVAADPAADSIVSTPYVDALTALSSVRQSHLVTRADQSVAKSRLNLLLATVAAAVFLAAAVGWPRQLVCVARPTLHRRRHSLSLRGPPALPLALI